MIAEDDRCDLNPDKVCDNCFRCLEPPAGQDYAKIEIEAVYTNEDYAGEAEGLSRVDSDAIPAYDLARPRVQASTLKGLVGKRRIP